VEKTVSTGIPKRLNGGVPSEFKLHFAKTFPASEETAAA
jgi:hypothetical protein